MDVNNVIPQAKPVIYVEMETISMDEPITNLVDSMPTKVNLPPVTLWNQLLHLSKVLTSLLP